MYIGQKIIKRAPFRWGIVGGGSTSNVGYKHRLGAMRDNTSFVLTAAAFDVDFERGKQFGIDLCMDPDRLYPDYKTMFEEEAKLPDYGNAFRIKREVPADTSLFDGIFRQFRNGCSPVCQ